MKIGLFTDSHYSSAELTCGVRRNNQSLRKIKEAMRFFLDEKCDLVIILGDVTDTEPSREMEEANLREIANVLDASGMNIICMMGNHDAFVLTPDDFYGILGEKYRPESISREGVNLLFLDACYFKTGVHYMPGDQDWTDTYYPHVDALRDELARCKGPVYVFMHQNIDPQISEDHCLYNAAQLRDTLEQSGKVKAVYQGHYHWGHHLVHNGIEYVTLAAMCQNENAWRVLDTTEVI